MEKFAFKVAINAGAIYLATILIEGFTFSGNLAILALIGFVITLFQFFVYPVVKILAFPLFFMSFGLFGALVNLGILWGIDYYLPALAIEGIVPLVAGSIVISFANLLFFWL